MLWLGFVGDDATYLSCSIFRFFVCLYFYRSILLIPDCDEVRRWCAGFFFLFFFRLYCMQHFYSMLDCVWISCIQPYHNLKGYSSTKFLGFVIRFLFKFVYEGPHGRVASTAVRQSRRRGFEPRQVHINFFRSLYVQYVFLSQIGNEMFDEKFHSGTSWDWTYDHPLVKRLP